MGEQASILIVDDNVSLCKTMSFALGRKGYAVTTAKDGPEALERVQESPFDMIFMDIKMPLMDGVETYRRIKQIRPEAVVMMMTAYAVEDLVQQALEEGAYGIVYKPLDIEKAVALIEEARQARKGALILVVDDDPATCITLKNILTRKGHQVGIAHAGEEAIAVAQKAAYDIIFVDIKLPTINGLETYLAIRKINPQAVAIMMTAYRQEMADLVEEALRNHAYTCLYKPLGMEELLGLVDEIRKRKRDRTFHVTGPEQQGGEGRDER
ncbi:MAG: response regulator [Chloroflexi bacterium]|nr:response regulator [Chloroflexota bacterium]